jgi:hypothetical protein
LRAPVCCGLEGHWFKRPTQLTGRPIFRSSEDPQKLVLLSEPRCHDAPRSLSLSLRDKQAELFSLF